MKTRYNAIRTDFSRYLKRLKGKSGSGISDVIIGAKYEHLRWLKTFTVSRRSSGNFRSSEVIDSQSTVPDVDLTAESKEFVEGAP